MAVSRREIAILDPAAVVKLNHFLQGSDAAIMHIWCRLGDVPEGRCFECPPIRGISSYLVSSRIRHAAILVAHTQIVKPMVREESNASTQRIDRRVEHIMIVDATSSAGEDVPTVSFTRCQGVDLPSKTNLSNLLSPESRLR